MIITKFLFLPVRFSLRLKATPDKSLYRDAKFAEDFYAFFFAADQPSQKLWPGKEANKKTIMPFVKTILITKFAPSADSFPFLSSQQKRKNIFYLRVLSDSVVRNNKFPKLVSCNSMSTDHLFMRETP